MSASALRELSYGQRRILNLFSGSNHDVVFIPHDPFELRICCALSSRGLLQPVEHDGYQGYELTDAGGAEINASQGAENHA